MGDLEGHRFPKRECREVRRRSPASTRHPRYPTMRHQLKPLSRNSSQIQRRFSPFLTGSGPQTEFDVTHSKQTTEKFLTGTRTAIKPARRGEPARRGGLFKIRHVHVAHLFRGEAFGLGRHSTGNDPRTSIHLLRVLSESRDRAFHRILPGTALQVECDVTHSKQTLGKFLPGATTARMANCLASSNFLLRSFTRAKSWV
jgi:hypothetical protein